MPIYEYKCENGHVFDMMQKMADDPITECIECGAPVRKVLHPVGISFKGSGFYSTDYKRVRRRLSPPRAPTETRAVSPETQRRRAPRSPGRPSHRPGNPTRRTRVATEYGPPAPREYRPDSVVRRVLRGSVLAVTLLFVLAALCISSALVVYTAWLHDLRNGVFALLFAVLSAQIALNWVLWSGGRTGSPKSNILATVRRLRKLAESHPTTAGERGIWHTDFGRFRTEDIGE